MKIDAIDMCNFMGIRGTKRVELPQTCALLGPNGIGKTTIMNAIRYGLTGEEPDGDIINKHSDFMRVTVTLTDPSDGQQYDFSREKTREKPSKWRINGKAANAKTMNSMIESIIRIPIEKVKVLSSAELVAAMKPQDFQSFILEYIPEKLKLDDIIAMIPDITLGMIEIMEANIPAEGVDVEVLDQFLEICKVNRKDYKANIASKRALLETKPTSKPADSKEDLEDALVSIKTAELSQKSYAARKAEYDRALANKEKHDKTLEALKAEYNTLSATKPDPVILEGLKKEEVSVQESLSNCKISKSGMESAVKRMKTELETLERPTCPLSPLITCHQDKSAAKEDIENSIAATAQGLEATEKEIAKLSAKLNEINTAKEAYYEGERTYNKKIQVAKQIKLMEDSVPVVPAEPEKPVSTADLETEKFQINARLKALADWEEAVQLSSQLETLTLTLNDYESLVKCMSDKGCVRTTLISTYLGLFEDVCNDRSTKVRPEIDFKFENEDGVVVRMNNGKGSYLKYDELSGGEKAYMLFIIMDMLNTLCGTNILLLDELSVIDEVSFDALLSIITECASDYDHIILAAVNHDDTVKSVLKHKIPQLSFVTADMAA